MRLQIANLSMLQFITAVLEPARLEEFGKLNAALIRAGAENLAAVEASAHTLLQWLDRHQKLLLRELSRAELVRLRKALVEQGANGRIADYATAEQLFFALEGLTYALGDFADKKTTLDAVFKSIDPTPNFSPQRFAAAVRAARARF